MPRQHVLTVITGLLMLFLISGGISVTKFSNEAEAGDKTDTDLVKLVNFLINNKGKEIELAGEKYKITGKEEIGVLVKVLACCKVFFNEGVNAVSGYAKIKQSSFEEGSVHALIPAENIPKMEASSSILEINFEPTSKDYRMQVLK